MEIQSDFKELLELFNKNGVEFLIVGGYALAFHGAPRYTGDIDIYVRPDLANAQKLMKAIGEFGFGGVGLSDVDFVSPERTVQLGYPPVRVDLLTSIQGVSWDEAWAGRVDGKYGPVPVPFLGRSQFIANKRATGRLKDLADVEALEKPPHQPRP